MAAKHSAPGPARYLVLSSDFRRKPLEAFGAAWKKYGDLIRFKAVPGMSLYFAIHPDAVQKILLGHGDTYIKARPVHEILRLLLGDGILVSEGDRWRRQRRMMQPAFHRESLAGIAGVMTRRARAKVDHWLALPDKSVVEVTEEMQELTLEIVGEALFGSDLGDNQEGFSAAFRGAANFIDHRINAPIKLPMRWPTARHRRFRRDRAVLDRVAADLIGRRRLDDAPRHDLLAMLIAARDGDGGGQLTDEELRDEVITLMIAGHETVSVTLTWAFHLLSIHPEIRDRLEHEVDHALGGRAPTPDDYPALSYARMVTQEALRLYPPVWALAREAARDNDLLGHTIPQGSLMMAGAFFTHRHPEFWTDPETFDPERFTDAEAAKRHRSAYYPFGGGSRMCIGIQFALVEATLIIASIVQRFRLEPATDRTVEIDPTFTLRPRNGLPMRLVRR